MVVGGEAGGHFNLPTVGVRRVSLSDANVIQENSGGTSATTSHVVSVSSGTTAGTTVIVILYRSASTITMPSGFAADVLGGAGATSVFRKSEVSAAETSWTFTTAANSDTAWYVVELTNVDLASPLDVTSAPTPTGTISNGGTLSTGTTAQNAGLGVIAFAAFGATTTGVAASWGSHTNGFTEVSDDSTGAVLSVATKYVDGTTGTFQSTATFATGGAPASNASAVMAVYRAADSPVVSPLELFVGFEWDTHGGMGNTGTSSLLNGALGPNGTFGTGWLVQAASGDPAFVGNYFFRIVQSAGFGGALFGSFDMPAPCFAFPVRVVSASGTPIVTTFNTSGSNDLNVRYDATNSKLGVQWGSGTTSWQSGTTSTNTWRWIDIRFNTNRSTHHVDWRIGDSSGVFTDQTSPADLTGQSSGISTARQVLGGYTTTSQTITVDFGSLFASEYYAAYPLGIHKVQLLVPETTGASVSGTSTNFSEFTANGTLAAFASTSGQRIDEVPPTVSASSDGVVQTAVAASDYMNFPMTTYTCAYDEVVAAVRALFAEWGGTGSGTGTIGYRGWDGTTETTFQAASASYDADSLTAISSTYPRWCAAMWQSTNGWTQTELNAAALRVGFSTDATPDMGISAAYLEVAVKQVDPVRTVTVEDPISATADIYVHPYTSSSVSYVITNNDATRSVNFNYSLAGTPQTPVTVSPSSNQTVQLNADAFGDVSDVSLEVI